MMDEQIQTEYKLYEWISMTGTVNANKKYSLTIHTYVIN